jgi:hypothetical protein
MLNLYNLENNNKTNIIIQISLTKTNYTLIYILHYDYYLQMTLADDSTCYHF